jgi:hypothetical protein
MWRMRPVPPPIPSHIAGIDVPGDDISAAAWVWAYRSLPDYLLTYSVRAYCWGAAIAAGEGWSFDRQILWTASLMHDYGLTRIARNSTCFEVEGGEIARRFLEREGTAAARADVVARAIVLHMQPTVTMADGVEAVLLDRSTSLDVRGVGYELVDGVRPGVMAGFPRRGFDHRFLAAIGREVAIRPTCQRRGSSTRRISPAGWPARRGHRPPELACDCPSRPDRRSAKGVRHVGQPLVTA